MEILEYGVKLADYMSPAAKSARDSLDKLTTSLKKGETELARYQAQFQRAKTLGDVGGMAKYADKYNETYKSIYSLTQQLETIPKVVETAGESFTTMAADLGAIAGPAAAVIGVVAGVVGAFAALSFEAAKLGIEQAEAKDQLLTMFDALGDGPGAGQATLDMLDDLEGSLGQTRVKLSEWTQDFESLGITDLGELRHQLDATGASFAIMGDKGANAYQHLEAKIQEAIDTHHGLKIADKGLAALGTTGANVADVAAKMGVTAAELRDELKKGSVDAQAFGDALSEAIIEKGQGPLENLRNDIGTLTARAHESFLKLFDGAGPAAEGFKRELGGVVGLLDEGQPSADALKWGITEFLDKVYEVGAEALPAIKHFFLETEILALESYIALAPTIFAFEDLNDALGPLGISVHNIDTYFRGLIHSLQVTAQLVGTVLPGLASAASGGLTDTIPKHGTNVAQGLADGIRGGKEKVSAASSDMASGANDGAVKTLDIHSPSRVGIRIGEHFGMGVAGGVRASERPVERASIGMGERMAEAPRMGFAPVLAPPARAASEPSASPYASSEGPRTITVNVGGLHFEGHDQKSAAEMTEVGVAALFERLAEQVGR